jgi:hypothetical protein
LTARAGAHPSTAGPAVGDTVLAEDGDIGQVERVLRSENAEPRFIVVATRGRSWLVRRPVIPCELIVDVDPRRRFVRVRGTRVRIGRLPESLPLVL